MRTYIIKFLLELQLLLIPLSLFGWDDSPACYKRLERYFFKEIYLYEALSLHNVYQSNWKPIYNELESYMREAPNMIKERARAMDNNPLEHPFQPEAAKKLLFDTLFDIFQKVLLDWSVNAENVINQNDIREMFEYIKNKQQDQIDLCFPENPQQ